ncbi:MAG: AMP-binding protein, partial [bacterium]|nr:AMP-binding protein [bacterium]
LIQRHESLRTSFRMLGEELVQRVHEPGELQFAIETHKVETENPDEETGQERQQVSAIITNFVRPFNLSQAPLLRVGLITRRENESLLLVDMHHIIADGVSHDVLNQDFAALHNDNPLQPLRIQYKDFAHWQNSELEKERMKQQENYWLNSFQGELPVVNLPTDYPRAKVQSFEGDFVRFEITTAYVARLKKLALKENATLYMVILALFNILLAKLGNRDDIIVGTPVAGRRHADLQKIIGMFVNTLALRTQPAGEKTFKQYLNEVNKQTLSAFENQEYQFEELVEKLEINRDASRNPIFDIMFSFTNLETETQPRPGEAPAGETPQTPPETNRDEITYSIAKFDLTLTITAGEHMTCAFEYCTKLFKRETIERFIRYFQGMTATVLDNPGQKLSGMEILSKEERRTLLYDFNDTGTEYPGTKTIHQLFEEQVEKNPGNIAVEEINRGTGDKTQSTLTYEELNKKSNRLARVLIAKGTKTGDIVGLLPQQRSLEMITGIVGILKAGGAYLPIDHQYPKKRITHMLQDSAAGILLITRSLEKGISFEKELVYLDDYENDNSDEYSENQHHTVNDNIQEGVTQLNTQPSNLAYIIYTSGTTGKPKGVAIEHRNVVRLMFNEKNRFQFDVHDVWTMFHSHCFDFSVWEMYGALLYGGKLILIPGMVTKDTARYLEILKEQKVTVLNQTPQAFYSLAHLEMQSPGKELNLKYVIFGGDTLKPRKLKQWKTKYPQTKLINMFGITETT